MTPLPIQRGGHETKRGPPGPNEPTNQSHSRTKQYQPPNEFQSYLMSFPPPMNPNINFPTGPPPTRTQGQRPPPCPCNHTNTPHHHCCNDSPGRNTNQLSSTITTQPIQMP
ncbi:hypothetical protein ATANTOWER_016732, partial [Ataeniobius toweri]|nr:hypothetical protein [Ataeniobius toweri]